MILELLLPSLLIDMALLLLISDQYLERLALVDIWYIWEANLSLSTGAYLTGMLRL